MGGQESIHDLLEVLEVGSVVEAVGFGTGAGVGVDVGGIDDGVDAKVLAKL
jgi:hypothetical protein